MGNFDHFSLWQVHYSSKASMLVSMLAFEQMYLVIEKIGKAQILFVCMGRQRIFCEVIWAFTYAVGQRYSELA
jgi:hypothetical protein